jgi:hypothetical protein
VPRPTPIPNCRRQAATTPVPPYVLQCLRLLRAIAAPRGADLDAGDAQPWPKPPRPLLPGRRWPDPGPNTSSLVLALHETAMAGLLGLLTSVLLHAAAPTVHPAPASGPSPAPPQAAALAAAPAAAPAAPGPAGPPARQLPANFVEAARLVMQALNNVCRRDLLAAQQMLASAHNRLEFFHLIGFLLAYCTEQWPAAAAADQGAAAGQELRMAAERAAVEAAAAAEAGASAPTSVPAPALAPHASLERLASVDSEGRLLGALLDEVLLVIGFFSVCNPSNQVGAHGGLFRRPGLGALGVARWCAVRRGGSPNLAIGTCTRRLALFQQHALLAKYNSSRFVAGAPL